MEQEQLRVEYDNTPYVSRKKYVLFRLFGREFSVTIAKIPEVVTYYGTGKELDKGQSYNSYTKSGKSCKNCRSDKCRLRYVEMHTGDVNDDYYKCMSCGKEWERSGKPKNRLSDILIDE